MKLFLQVFIILALSHGVVLGDEYRDVTTITLKKDEQKKILVKYGDITKLFKFSWTLYKNEGLVIHRSYDRKVAQNILYLREKNRFFRLELRPRGSGHFNAAYILVKFKEFKYETREAVFELFLFDKDMEVSVTHLNNG
ncbi:hypothetical protein SMGD1_0156 [Sulfurimonas gotlandica GD1]|uniref:Uncharacterized protein n=1 Tax=Sulfurimonas gotlandica (strain DSM 19862 / JCM 16533 / GD1) TaxID=929558 RepID=B6BLM5_SULGG|nr:hypothetical protein [Sulfurimonas gotlandica]EDZ62081.1 conserved hypothetical protein [Sulfurimonas gotlandica GD1]EHP28683.1 hypothetical protein SMGD1_0156 [Sulfurimonas gotlandica GD1]